MENKTGLLVCFVCHTIDEIPNYMAEEADNDPRIGFIMQRHLNRHPSTRDRLSTEWASLGEAPTKYWKDPSYRKQITEQILKGNGQTGFDAEFYDVQNQMKEDAAKCFQSHNRPAYKSNTQPKCADYMTLPKEIKPDTAAERREAGLQSYDDTKLKREYICSYCPYHVSVKNGLNK
jgi:hypothetical protein